jgi:hypothetical protein
MGLYFAGAVVHMDKVGTYLLDVDFEQTFENSEAKSYLEKLSRNTTFPSGGQEATRPWLLEAHFGARQTRHRHEV